MARPFKTGVDYFPLDVTMNDRVRLIEAEFGVVGFGILIKLYQKIYKDRGYYCDWNNEVALLFANDCKVGGNVVSEVLSALFRRGILDQSIYKKYGILTSEGIQKRYLEMVKRRLDCKIDDRYALVDVTSVGIDVNSNDVNVNNNGVNVDRSTQRKEEENEIEISINHSARASDNEDYFELRQKYIGGKLGQGLVRMNNAQFGDLCQRLSLEEMDHYFGVIVECEKSGKHFRRKTHYQAILDMVDKDRKLKD